jgi:predicted enzyme related to lactoylglutathione lyase
VEKRARWVYESWCVLTIGFHHVTFLTEDIDRLVSFYERVFGARKTFDIIKEGCATSLP